MRRKNTAGFLPLALASVLLSPYCATLTRSREQLVPVTSSPAGAAIIVNGIRKGVTPLRIWLTREAKDQVIRIERPGYNAFEIRMSRSFSGFHAVSDVIVGGIAGLAAAMALYFGRDETAPDASICVGTGIGGFLLIDAASHAGYTLTPKDITVRLTKADGLPSVDTMLIGAADFRNVKWIRVRGD